MKNRSLLILGLTLILSYASAFSQKKTIDPAELQVLREIVLTDSIPTVYFKTVVADLNQPLSRQLFYLSDFDVCNALVNQDSMTLNKVDRDFIVERFSTMEVQNINKLIRDPKNHTLKQLDGHNWIQVSLPVVFRDGNYAIYYSKGAYSGQFILMKNIDGHWRDVCYSAVWSE